MGLMLFTSLQSFLVNLDLRPPSVCRHVDHWKRGQHAEHPAASPRPKPADSGSAPGFPTEGDQPAVSSAGPAPGFPSFICPTASRAPRAKTQSTQVTPAAFPEGPTGFSTVFPAGPTRGQNSELSPSCTRGESSPETPLCLEMTSPQIHQLRELPGAVFYLWPVHRGP